MAAAAGQDSTGFPRRDTGRRQPSEQRDARAVDHLKTSLNLDSEQSDKIDAILGDARRAAASLNEELRLQRARLFTAVREGKSEAEVQSLTEAQGRIYARIAANEAWAASRIFGLLTADQRKQAEGVFAQMDSLASPRPSPAMRPFGGR